MGKVVTWLWYPLVLTIPFSVRLFITGPTGFAEYQSVFLYASDIVLLCFVLSMLPKLLQSFKTLPGKRSLLIFLGFAVVSVVSCSLLVVGAVAFARLLLFVFAAIGGGALLRESRVLKTTLVLVSLLALFQATVAIMQFTAQGSVGLKMLGESPISVADPGTAKVTVEGAHLIRAYGTLPDPNILAGFLLVGLLALGYLFLKADKGLYVDAFDITKSISANFQRYLSSWLLYARIVTASAMFIVLMGLIFTFSRSGWASAALSMVLLLILAGRNSVRATGRFVALLLIIGGVLLFFFSSLILPRTSLRAAEPSVSYRLEYAHIGLETTVAHPLFGTGIGNQVQTSFDEGRYAVHGMKRAWEYQPVHNLYLLIASEIGIIGALAFCFFLVIVMKRLATQKSLEAAFALSLLAGLLMFGLFDHFLWDLQAGRLMFWLAVALSLSQKPSSFNG